MKKGIGIFISVFIFSFISFGQSKNCCELNRLNLHEKQTSSFNKTNDYLFNLHNHRSIDNKFRFKQSKSLLPDSIVNYRWCDEINNWIGHSYFYGWFYVPYGGKSVYSYDENGNTILEESYYWNSDYNKWVASYKYEFGFDKNNNDTTNILFYWNEELEEWVESTKATSSYDDLGNKILSVIYNWDDNKQTWNEDWREESIYTLNNKLSELICYHWDNRWVLTHKYQYKYDSNGNLIEYINLDYHGVLVDKEERVTWVYNVDDKLEEHIVYDCNDLSDDWYEQWKAKYEYDSLGRQRFYYSYFWNPSGWMNERKQEYLYKPDKNQVVLINYVASEIDWQKYSKNEYTYDNNGQLLIDLIFSWDTVEWVKDGKIELAYDSKGNQTLKETYNWSIEQNDWVGTSYLCYRHEANRHAGKRISEYDENDNRISFMGYSWDFESNYWFLQETIESKYDANGNFLYEYTYISDSLYEWSYDRKLIYYYASSGSTLVPGISKNETSIYPNPTTGFIKFNIASTNILQFSLYDTQGRKLIERQVQGGDSFEISHLNSGIYLFHITNKGNVTCGKLIKE